MSNSASRIPRAWATSCRATRRTHGVRAPKNTPVEIVDNEEINAGFADPKIKARLGRPRRRGLARRFRRGKTAVELHDRIGAYGRWRPAVAEFDLTDDQRRRLVVSERDSAD
jgi:hypothetical protein